MTTKDRNIPNGEARCFSNQDVAPRQEAVDRRNSNLRQESSIRWRLDLRTKAYGDLEAKTTALEGLVTIRGTWTHIVISYQYEMWFLMIGAQ
jgi:hypothetical protein